MLALEGSNVGFLVKITLAMISLEEQALWSILVYELKSRDMLATWRGESNWCNIFSFRPFMAGLVTLVETAGNAHVTEKTNSQKNSDLHDLFWHENIVTGYRSILLNVPHDHTSLSKYYWHHLFVGKPWDKYEITKTVWTIPLLGFLIMRVSRVKPHMHYVYIKIISLYFYSLYPIIWGSYPEVALR